MTKLPDQLWPGDHVRINGRDLLFDEWKEPWSHPDNETEYDGFVRAFADTGSVMVMLREIEKFEFVAKPEIRFTDRPLRGDWLWQWYTCAEPCASIYWKLVGPFVDKTYTIRCVNRYDLERHVKGSRRVFRPGWINELSKVDRQLIDRYGAPVPFFTPPFLPECLRLTNRELAHQPRLF